MDKSRGDTLMAIEHIEEAYASISAYSMSTGRLGLQDLIVFDTLVNMHQSDMDEIYPTIIWRSTPDEIMQDIIDSKKTFIIDFGWEDLFDSLREYMTMNKFIVDSDDSTEEKE